MVLIDNTRFAEGYRLKSGICLTDNNGPGVSYNGIYIDDWELTHVYAGDLDECNGITVDGQHGYYVTKTDP